MAVFTPVVAGAPEIEVRPDIIRGPRVFVGGTEILATRERGRPRYMIPLADGTERPLILFGSLLGLRGAFDGREYPIEPRLTFFELFLVVLPLALITFGGLAGVVGAGVGTMVNLVVMKRPWPAVGRVLAALAVFAVAAAVVVVFDQLA